MRASSVFILMMVINGFCFFGVQVYNQLGPGGMSPTTTQTMPFDYFFNVNSTGPGGDAVIYSVNGTPVNTTAVDQNWNTGGVTGIVVSAVSGLTNLASSMISFMNLLISFIAAPFNLLYIAGILEYQVTYIFGAAYILAVILSLYQILTGRNV